MPDNEYKVLTDCVLKSPVLISSGNFRYLTKNSRLQQEMMPEQTKSKKSADVYLFS